MEPAKVIIALDKLNSWVRSKSYGDSGARRMVYWMKGQILQRPGDLQMTHRGLDIAVTCRDCDGKGKYIDSNNYQWPHCRACSSRGTARLKFVETIILGIIVDDQPSAVIGPRSSVIWHTPRHRFPLAWPETFQIDMNYAPNRPGKDLEPWEAAQALNETEACFPRPHDYYTDYGMFNDFDYRLDVGETPKACAFCSVRNAPALLCRYGVSRKGIRWTDHACKECDKRFSKQSATAIFDAFPMPADLIAHAEIQKWMDRHSETYRYFQPGTVNQS